MTPLDKLITHFERFPGIGARQAKRFAYHLLSDTPAQTHELASLIQTLHANVTECTQCHRFFSGNTQQTQCRVCSDAHRDQSTIMVVEHDTDMLAIERSGTYNGLYFILGGTVPLLNEEATQKVRGAALKQLVTTRASEGLSELILAFSINPDGENTGRYVEALLHDLITTHALRVTTLGRGLSTGSELEYADPETIKNAFSSRTNT